MHKKGYDSFGKRLQAVRVKLGYTEQKDFAAALGKLINEDGAPLDKSTYSKYELDKLPVSNKVLIELFSTFKVNKDWWETGTGNMFQADAQVNDAGVNYNEPDADAPKSNMMLSLGDKIIKAFLGADETTPLMYEKLEVAGEFKKKLDQLVAMVKEKEATIEQKKNDKKKNNK